ncbi:MAG: helical bundle domain-containing protein [Legionella sp.]|nr:helical bundle domain-containing protein [Legionella sp.]
MTTQEMTTEEMTTQEYLMLLREGDYNHVFEWRDALLKRYSPEKCFLETDVWIPLMAYELINNGFTIEDDYPHIEILNAKLDSPMQFSDGLDYYWILFISAALQCYVFADNNLLPFYQTEENLDLNAISEWMARDNGVLTEAQNSGALSEKRNLLMERSAQYQQVFDGDSALVEVNKSGALQEKEPQYQEDMNQIALYQINCTDYRDFLLKLSKPEDGLLPIRLGVINALHDYLHKESIEKTPLFSKILSSYLKQIRALQPLDGEEGYLSNFEPKSLSFPRAIIQKCYEASTQTFRFFAAGILNTLIPIPTQGNALIAPEPVIPNPDKNEDDSSKLNNDLKIKQ